MRHGHSAHGTAPELESEELAERRAIAASGRRLDDVLWWHRHCGTRTVAPALWRSHGDTRTVAPPACANEPTGTARAGGWAARSVWLCGEDRAFAVKTKLLAA